MLDKTQQQINKLKEEIEKLKQQGLNDLAFEAEKSLKIISIEFEKGQKEYENGESQLKQGQKELEANQNSFNVKKISAENEITYARNQINEKRDELAQSELLIKKGEKDIEQGRTTLEQKKKQTYQELHDAEEEIKKSEEQLNNLPQPFWYYLDLETNYGYVSLKGDADRIAAIATIFPVIFFLVAALVALTTMTRMVEEERTLIGTYKALGYTKMRIGMKYITYGLISSFLGSLAGVFLGQLTLPSVIWNAYRMMYVAPSAILKIDGFYTTIAFICAVGVTILATFMALASSLKENAAMLMMPKAPKKGKQILLQRIPFIWNHLSFSYKVTFRNLFRYKKRLFMTIIGIAGCTGLLLTGFGVHDSISDIVSVQFREINKYDTTIQIK
ncbi:MAG: FtsX-like permease family protein, partial [Oscillospiraceae bacterium]